MACEVWFYHLERDVLPETLHELLGKALGRGWRVLVHGSDPRRLKQLDEALWTKDDGFLPHGLASQPHAERQPVLLSEQLENRNGAKALILLDPARGASLDDYERCIVLMRITDDEQLGAMRSMWTELKGRGHPVTYWKQPAGGGWEKVA